MSWIFWVFLAIGVVLALTYSVVLLFGAPFLPTFKRQGHDALDLLNLKPGQVFVDLGCGDGRLLILAASRGLHAVGYELNPFLALYAWLRTRRYDQQIKVKWGNFWRADLSDADGVFAFLIGHFMRRLDKLLSQQAKNRQIKLVSNAFKIPGKKPFRCRGALYLYIYRAPKS